MARGAAGDPKRSLNCCQIRGRKATSTEGDVEMRESDMRSLARPGLLRIFAPLDPHERLPRELLPETRRLPLVSYPEFKPRRTALGHTRSQGEASRHGD